MAVRLAVCFHNLRRCAACWPPNGDRPPEPRRHRLRCVTCGRYRRRVGPARCPACIALGVEALTLFDETVGRPNVIPIRSGLRTPA